MLSAVERCRRYDPEELDPDELRWLADLQAQLGQSLGMGVRPFRPLTTRAPRLWSDGRAPRLWPPL